MAFRQTQQINLAAKLASWTRTVQQGPWFSVTTTQWTKTNHGDRHQQRRHRHNNSNSNSTTSATLDGGPLYKRYQAMVQEKELQEDPTQIEALKALERVRQELVDHGAPRTTTSASAASSTNKSNQSNSSAGESSLSSFFGSGSWWGVGGGGGSTAASSATSSVSSAMTSKSRAPPRGVYLHGGVGCGKTMLMNIFYDSIKEDLHHPWSQNRQKIHFHKFMLRVHQDMHAARYNDDDTTTSQKQRSGDAILPAVIRETAGKGRLICLDEFQVTDVADAMILKRLFTGLLDQEGCVLIATSNRPPDDLYRNGLQRDRFIPFIELLKEKCEIVSMEKTEKDYRLLQKFISGSIPVYFVKGATKESKAQARREFDDLFYALLGSSQAVASTTLKTETGRKVKIPRAALTRGICRFSFEELCQRALGAADYLVIGQAFHTVFVEQIPQLTLNEINWVRRFITFIDSMYECNVKLILHAKTPVAEIFARPEDTSKDDEVFAFDRTVSRLEEMSSAAYLQRRWAGAKKEGSSRRASVSVGEPSLGDDQSTAKSDDGPG